MDDDDPAVHRLEGTSEEVGGLIIKKKINEDGLIFKAPTPRVSKLGLDLLAAKKRKEKELEELESTKKSRYLSYKNDWEDDEDAECDDKSSKISSAQRYVFFFSLEHGKPGNMNRYSF